MLPLLPLLLLLLRLLLLLLLLLLVLPLLLRERFGKSVWRRGSIDNWEKTLPLLREMLLQYFSA